MRRLRQLLALLLCLTVVAGPAIPDVQAAASADEAPCAMAEDGAAPACDDCAGGQKALCAQKCSAAYAGVVVIHHMVSASAAVSFDRAATTITEAFRSRAGPPGLQPPR
jgi:hypothetical protein